MGTIAFVFYFFPHVIYFATPLYVFVPLFFFCTNYLIPYGTKLFSFKDPYLESLVVHPNVSWAITTIAFVLSVVGFGAMSGSIYNRYVFMRAVDQSLSGIGADGLALADPRQLAIAFTAEPERPEVPFILTRSSRILSADMLTPMFGRYNKVFYEAVDRDAVLKRYRSYEPRKRIAIGDDTSALPRLDPIRYLTGIAFETNDPQAQKWALETLSNARKDDSEAQLQVEIWKNFLSSNGGSGADKLLVMRATISNLEKRLSVDTGSSDFSGISFVSDQIFQTGLDYLASTKIEAQSMGSSDEQRCAFNDDIIEYYERILVLRRRLGNSTDLIWWEPPGKMFLYYLYLYLGHQTINIGLDTIEKIKSCPKLIERLQRLYDAPAFRSFQDPEVWTQGTPLSSAFNGAAGVTILREWLKLGW